ncbi:MAG: hypothetical protein ACLQU4_03970 [Limisphaerales bacterium]
MVDTLAKTMKGPKAQTPADWRALALWFFKGTYHGRKFRASIPDFRAD